ncbi:tRNA threonylcarbamoyladenosine biosynthesis protein TsaB [Buchnera aphidicola (Tuberolachnus salignus)]|uniref:tRNA threonylcarbamoyladenosine biosynthesis protein TsaB n=1 Tax=Buchnera aphidicola subsp. Tuberolachnus salignus TaxID=98804 RepID=A0A170PBT6_BUCTT|nr:tRNA threonylcarbamoyladenosine biosynthesis protein TsaB [Buchnera aphidicola (Tuberolachnus salignus)]
MTILAIETTFDNCSIALLHNNVLYQNKKLCFQQHEKHILNMITKILKKSNINFKHIQIIAYNEGPGNFTGIRISTIVANALSMSLNIPIFNFSTFQIISEQIWLKYFIKKILIKLKISKNYIFIGKFFRNIKNQWIGTYQQYTSKNIDKKYILNNLFTGLWAIVGFMPIEKIQKKETKFLQIKIKNIRAQDIISCVLSKIKNIQYFEKFYKHPIYLKNTILSKK